MITRTYDKNRKAWIYDRGDRRAVIYKVQGRWVVTVGTRCAGLVYPAPESVESFGLREFAQAHAEGYLGR